MPKLLIVDDEVDVREFAANFLRKRGLEVFRASGENLIFQELKKIVFTHLRPQDGSREDRL